MEQPEYVKSEGEQSNEGDANHFLRNDSKSSMYSSKRDQLKADQLKGSACTFLYNYVQIQADDVPGFKIVPACGKELMTVYRMKEQNTRKEMSQENGKQTRAEWEHFSNNARCARLNI